MGFRSWTIEWVRMMTNLFLYQFMCPIPCFVLFYFTTGYTGIRRIIFSFFRFIGFYVSALGAFELLSSAFESARLGRVSAERSQSNLGREKLWTSSPILIHRVFWE